MLKNLPQKVVKLKHDKGLPDDLITDHEIQRGADLALYDHDLNEELTPAEEAALKKEASLNIFRDPKEQILTLLVCVLSSFTQGWNQSANGNLGKLCRSCSFNGFTFRSLLADMTFSKDGLRLLDLRSIWPTRQAWIRGNLALPMVWTIY